MKTKIFKWIVFIGIFFVVIQTANIASADDHHKYKDYNKYQKYENHDDEHYKKHDHDDKFDFDNWDEDKYKRNNEYQSTIGQSSYWNIWTRDTNILITNNLPVQQAKNVSFELNGKSENLFVLPSNGQLLVSGEKMAKFLQLKYEFYNQSRILEVSNDKEELIVRAGSNAAYENMLKTPMPIKAMYYENTVYLPVSVIANAFGYSVNWDEEKETFILKQFN